MRKSKKFNHWQLWANIAMGKMLVNQIIDMAKYKDLLEIRESGDEPLLYLKHFVCQNGLEA